MDATSFPDSPEAVALCLFAMIVSSQDETTRRNDFAGWALDLFAQCLNTAKGKRCVCVLANETQH